VLPSVAKIWKTLLRHLTFELYKGTPLASYEFTVKDPTVISKKLPTPSIKHIGQ
jgi:hypothetical protein